MPEIRPFRAVVYNKEKIKKLAGVVSPPYDVIPPAMQNSLYRKNPYNVIRLILGKIDPADDEKENRYTRAGAFLGSWLDGRVLVRDERRALYIYSQRYRCGGDAVERIGFIGLMGLGPDKANKVLPHENTLPAPKVDRLNLTRTVKANLEPIFVLYDDKGHKVARILKSFASRGKPFIDIALDSVRHRVWRLDDPSRISKIEELMGSKDIFIADGHHRYEVSCAYAAEAASSGLSEELNEAARFMMVYFVESDERMLTVLPAHRLVKDIGPLDREEAEKALSEFFHVERLPSLGSLESRLLRLRKEHAFGMYLGKRVFYLLKLKDARKSDAAIKDKSGAWKRLDVSILHLFIFKHILKIRDEDDNIEYMKDAKEAARSVDVGGCRAVFFLNPTEISQVKNVARLGEKMPKKATYFYPKPLSGLVINRFGS